MGNVNRREILQTLAAVPAFGAAAAVPPAPAIASSSKPTRLRIASAAPSSSAGLADDAHRFCRTLERLTNGRFELALVEGSRKPFEMLAAGNVEAVFGYEAAKASLHPAFAYFAGLPGPLTLPASRISDWLTSDLTRDHWDRLSAALGVKTLHAGHTITRATLWSPDPLSSLDQLADRSVYCDGLAADVIEGLGGRPARANGPQRALNAHRDAIVLCRQAADGVALGLAEMKPFVTTTTLGGEASVSTLTVHRGFWDRLPGEARTELSEACHHLAASGARGAHASNAGGDEAILRALVEAGKITSYDVPGAIAFALNRVAEAVIADIAAFDSHARAINIAYFQHVSQFRHFSS